MTIDSPLLETLPLVEEEAKTILMHRDAHFAGQFSVMVDYYAQEGKGVHFRIEEVEQLKQLQSSVGEDLAPLLLSEAEMEALTLHYAHDFSEREISRIVGRSERAVHSLLHRAKQKARERLVRDAD